MKFNLIAAILFAFALTSCSTVPESTIPPENEFVVVDPDTTPELSMKDVTWEVWNQKRLVEEGAKTSNRDSVFFVLTQEQAGHLFDNLTQVSDVFAKSIESNQYWKKAVDEYRAKKKAAAEEAAKQEKKGKKK